MRYTHMSLYRAVVLMALLQGNAATAQSIRTVTKRDCRPVAATVEATERWTGSVITYEDPEIIFEGDLRDDARPSQRSGRDSRILVPKETNITVSYQADSKGKPIDLAKFVHAVTDAGSNEGVRFKAWQSGPETFHVAPTAQRDFQGHLQTVVPALDTLISFPPRQRSGEEFIAEICKAVGAARGRNVVPNLLARELMSVETFHGAEHERARDVLSTFLAAKNEKLSWQYLCQPEYGCVLNVFRVKAQAVRPKEFPLIP